MKNIEQIQKVQGLMKKTTARYNERNNNNQVKNEKY